MFGADVLTFREFMMGEPLPLATLQNAVLEFLRERNDVVLFGAQAVNGGIDHRITQCGPLRLQRVDAGLELLPVAHGTEDSNRVTNRGGVGERCTSPCAPGGSRHPTTRYATPWRQGFATLAYNAAG